MKQDDIKLPPQSLEAEQLVLASVFLDEFAFTRMVTAGLQADHFYREIHQIIFKLYERLARKGPVGDLVLLSNGLKETGELEKIGGPAYLSELADCIGSTVKLEYYIQIVMRKAALREIVKMSRQAAELAYLNGADPLDIAERFALSLKGIQDGNILPVERSVEELKFEISKYVTAEPGSFTQGQIYTRFNLKEKEQKQMVSEVLEQLRDSEIIEPYGGRRGNYRLIESDTEIIDWMESSTERLDLNWPFRLESKVRMLPGTVFLVEGEKESGKTAFCLNFLKLNMHRDFPKEHFRYFSSEFDGPEMKERLSFFDDPGDPTIDEWFDGFEFYFRPDHFHDVIDPDGINLIDYVSHTDEFFKNISSINNIHKKMVGNKGVAVVCLQKDPRTTYAVGGPHVRHNPRVVIQLMNDTEGTHTLKIVAAKSRAVPSENPNGLAHRYKLVQGAKFISIGEWFEPKQRRNGR